MHVLLLVSLLAVAGPAPSPADSSRGARWALLPIVFSSPDTGFALGLLPQLFFRTSPAGRPSRLRLDAYYTQERQFHVQLAPSFWLHRDAVRLAGKASFKEWPTSFYGIGGTTGRDGRERFTERLAAFSADLQGRVRPGLFVGLAYTLRAARITDAEPGGRLAAGAVTGSRRGTASGAGVVMSWDTRDNVYYPTGGSYHQLGAHVFGGVLGSDYGFTRLSVDLRRYVRVVSSHVLALQAVVRTTGGAAPFRMLPGVGEVLRGYGSSRYVDRHMVALRAEVRVVPIWWRLGLAVFGGFGDVFERPAELRLSRFKYAAGLGLRLQLYRGEKINVRWDYGVGRDAAGDYLDLPEAF